MKEESKKKSFIARRWWLIPIAVLLLVAIVFFSYVSVYYHADDIALAAMESKDCVTVSKTSYGYLFDGPAEDRTLIFYPGGKVDEKAYAPLLSAFASAGMDVCLVKMPFRLAVFGANAATKVISEHSYEKYYLGGHSLGGAMAANYAATHGEELAGLILLAAYPTKKLPSSMLEILIVGSEDKVVNREKIESGRALASEKYRECVIEGGNHAGFGSYGAQKGDGDLLIAPVAQWEETVSLVLSAIE